MKQKILFYGLLLCLCCGIYNGTYAQDFTQLPAFRKANSIWMLIANGVNMSTNPVTLLPSSASGGTVASVCHPRTGELLFYSNGFGCWNRNHQLMPDGLGLGGGGLSQQNICIVPFIGDTSKYYLFYIKQSGIVINLGGGPGPPLPPGPFDFNLTYSVVDMSLDNGLGAIVPGKKNIIAAHGPLSDMMTTVPGNNCDVWLLTHAVDGPDVKAFHITREGVDTTPVVSTLLPGITGIGAFVSGGMAVSPNRKKVAMVSNNGLMISGFGFGVYGTIGAQVADFNPDNGTLSGNMVLSDTSMGTGTCFSSDNSKLYCAYTNGYQAANTCGYMAQYDMNGGSLPAILASRYTIPFTGITFRRWGDTIFTAAFLGYFSRSNLAGAASNFIPGTTAPFLPPAAAGVSLGSSLGSDVVYAFAPDTIALQQKDTCFFRKITIHAPAGYQSYVWSNGVADSMQTFYATGQYKVYYSDGCHTYIQPYQARKMGDGLGPADTTICKEPPLVLQPDTKGQPATFLWQDGSTGNSFTVLQDGVYRVRVSFAAGCTIDDSIAITFKDVEQHLGGDRILCKGDPINVLLKANVPAGATVSWNTGATGESISVTDTGDYSVRVSAGKCVGKDKVHIGIGYCVCQPLVPNAFSPNGDGTNDIFRPVLAPDCPLTQYSLSVYNRFGQRVFFSAKPDQGWDGLFNGQPAEVGAYMYELRYTGGIKKINEYKKGDLNLIR